VSINNWKESFIDRNVLINRAAASSGVVNGDCRGYLVNYSSNFLLLEYSLISISSCKFSFLVAVFCSQLTISPHRCNVSHLWGEKPQNRPLKLLKYRRFVLRAMLPVTILTLIHQFTTPFFIIGSLYKSTSSINEYSSTH